MKNIVFKLLIVSIFITSLFGCQTPIIAKITNDGIWENTIKNSDGTPVLTTLEISQKEKFFSGVMTIEVKGEESETLKIPTKKINFSGNVINDGKKLVITDIESDISSYKESSSFEISENGKFLTLHPGEIKFKRK